MYQLDDTIAAIATALAPAARGVIRISGPQVVAIVDRCFAAADGIAIQSCGKRCVVPGSLAVPSFSRSIPCDLYLWPDQRSYTGQPVIELHTIGSPPLLSAILQQMTQLGARLAQPGEFTLRAFLSGRLDLAQAEAVLGVIDASSERELETALEQLAGGVGRPITQARDEMLDLLAEVEAGLDFAEEDIQFISASELQRRLAVAAKIIDQLIERMQLRTELRGEARCVLIGRPNTGKSSLFNRLAPAAGALVSATAGTTRDYLVATLSMPGRSCQLVDTAGCGDADHVNVVDTMAHALASRQRKNADIELFCLDVTRPLDSWEEAYLANLFARRIIVLTKCDQPAVLTLPNPLHFPTVCTSSVDGSGLDELRAAIINRLEQVDFRPGEVVADTANRCFDSLDQAAQALRRCREMAASCGQEEFVAAELRLAIAELGKVVGAVYTDDLLDRIFSRFCIGK